MSVADIVDTYIYRAITKDFRLSYATAAGLFGSVISTGLLLFANRASRMLGQEGIY
jgi:putative aldouronate transport system permease protein